MAITDIALEDERGKLRAQTEEEKILVERVKHLAERCRSEPHLYLKFYGD